MGRVDEKLNVREEKVNKAIEACRKYPPRKQGGSLDMKSVKKSETNVFKIFKMSC